MPPPMCLCHAPSHVSLSARLLLPSIHASLTLNNGFRKLSVTTTSTTTNVATTIITGGQRIKETEKISQTPSFLAQLGIEGSKLLGHF